MVNKLIRHGVLYLFIISFFVYGNYSCSPSRNLLVQTAVRDSGYLNYDKVKLTLRNGNDEYKIRGFINTGVDSFICFRFWGPVGYEVGKGVYIDKFLFHDAIRNKTYFNYTDQIKATTGLVLSRESFQFLLRGSIKNFYKAITNDNTNTFVLKSMSENSIQLNSINHLQKLTVRYKFLNNYPQFIFITIGGNISLELKIEIIELSGGKKFCLFKV